MKKTFLFATLALFFFNVLYSQTDSLNFISEQIKIERDYQLKLLNEQLISNEEEVIKFRELIENTRLAQTDNVKAQDRIKNLENLQLAFEKRLEILEKAPKIKIEHNGQLAFIELLSIQRDIRPADLFVTSQDFFKQLGNIGMIQQYKSFTDWKSEYDKWYSSQKSNDQMRELINNSITLISDAANNVPLYGSIVQTVSSGAGAIVSSLGRKQERLKQVTPVMLRLLNATSQFENQKSIIDYEWELINRELEQLKKENEALLDEQLNYYGIKKGEYEVRYLKATTETERDKFKASCRDVISKKFNSLESDSDTKGKWYGQVEVYMYKVQSLRMRFGQLTTRMFSNIERYEHLISVYSNNENFPQEFTSKINGLEKSLHLVKEKFYSSFNPAKYIEDSATMYIEKQ